MNDKEKLDEIVDRFNAERKLYRVEIAWVIQQAGQQAQRVQALEDILDKDARQDVLEGLYEENKRYREQFELIVSDTHCKEHEYVSVRHLIRKRAQGALERETQ